MHLVLVLSDLHFGKLTPNFNLDIASKRIRELPEKLRAEIAFPSRVQSITVVLGGDEIEGEDIHGFQNSQNEAPVSVQADAACEAIWTMLLKIVHGFPDAVVFVRMVYGNHGRTSKTAHPETNHENALHKRLHDRVTMHGDPRLSSKLNLGAFEVFECNGWHILVHHKGIKHIGTPSGRLRMLGYMLRFRTQVLIHGHWHRAQFETERGMFKVSNGSLSGADDLSDEMGVWEPPRQVFFEVDKTKGPVNFNFLEWSNDE